MAPNIIGNVTSSPGCLLLSNWCIWASKFRLHDSAWSLGRWNIIWEFSPISRFVLIPLFLFVCFLCAYFFPLTFLIWAHKQMIIHLFIPTAFTIWWYWVFFYQIPSKPSIARQNVQELFVLLLCGQNVQELLVLLLCGLD